MGSQHDAVEDVLHDAVGMAFLIAGKAELAARVAEAEGRVSEAAKLRALVRTAFAHAEGHMAFLGGLQDTDENLVSLSELMLDVATTRSEGWSNAARESGLETMAEWFEHVGEAMLNADEGLDEAPTAEEVAGATFAHLGQRWSQN